MEIYQIQNSVYYGGQAKIIRIKRDILIRTKTYLFANVLDYNLLYGIFLWHFVYKRWTSETDRASGRETGGWIDVAGRISTRFTSFCCIINNSLVFGLCVWEWHSSLNLFCIVGVFGINQQIPPRQEFERHQINDRYTRNKEKSMKSYLVE